MICVDPGSRGRAGRGDERDPDDQVGSRSSRRCERALGIGDRFGSNWGTSAVRCEPGRGGLRSKPGQTIVPSQERTMREQTNRDKLLALIRQHGPGIASSAVTGALGFLAGDPTTAASLGVVSYGVTKALEKVGGDVRDRKLSPREQMRVGAACAFVAAEVQERLDRGERLRDDGFFTPDETDRSAAEELLEGVILECEREHEERKLRFVSNIFANAVFLDIPAADANAVLSVAERLTYRQICLLSVVRAPGRFPYVTGFSDPDKLVESLTEYPIIAQDLVQLQRTLGIIGSNYSTVRQLEPGGFVGLTAFGDICFNLMSLDTIPPEDVLRQLLGSVQKNDSAAP